MTQFKDKAAKNVENINAGLFTYPVLMVAILLYNADFVPVGDDQKQHVEICRTSRRLQRHLRRCVAAWALILKVGARIMSLVEPDKKCLNRRRERLHSLSDSNDAIMKKFKRAVTDSEMCVRYDPKQGGHFNLMAIYPQ